MKIEKNRSKPIYQQLSDNLRQAILRHRLKPGMLLPSENDLIKSHDISRGTVRKALQQLIQEGLIETFPGKGSVVSHKSFDYGIGSELGFFSQTMRKAGRQPGAKVIELTELSPAPEFVLEGMHLPAGDSVTYLRRVRTVDGEPWAIEHSYFPREIGTLLVHEELGGSVYDLLQGKLGFVFANSKNRIGAGLLDEETAELLESTPGLPVIIVTRAMHLAGGRVVEYAKDYHRADRMHFTFDFNYLEESPRLQMKSGMAWTDSTGATRRK